MPYLKDSPRNVFQGLTYSEPVPQFVGEVDYTKALDKLEVVGQESDALAGLVKPVENLNQDLDNLKNKMDYYKSNLNTIADNPDLSPHQKLKATRKLSQEYIEDVNHGQLGAIKGSYLSRQKDVQDAYKLYEDKKITKEVLNSSLHKANSSYTGAMQNEDGTFNRYNPSDKTNYINPEPLLEDLAKGWKESGIKGIDYTTGKPTDWKMTPDNKFLKKVGKDWVGVSEQEMLPVLRESIKNDTTLQQSLYAEAYAKGYNQGLRGEELNEYINKNADKPASAALNRVLKKYGWNIIDYSSDIKETAEQARAGELAAENAANPERTMEAVTNNPNAILEFINPTEQITLNDFLTQKGITAKTSGSAAAFGMPSASYTVNGKEVSLDDYDRAVTSATKEYEGWIQLKDGNVNGFLQNPEIKEKFGDLPTKIVNQTPKGKMSNNEYTKLIVDKINEVGQHFKTLNYQITPSTKTEATERETNQLKGNLVLDDKGKIKSGSIGELQYATIYLSGEHGNGEPYTLIQAAKKLNTTPEKLAVHLNLIGTTKGDNPFTPSGREATTLDGNGSQIQLIVSDKTISQERNKVNEPLYIAHSVLRNPRIQESKPFTMNLLANGTNIDVKVKSIGHDMWNHYDKDGNILYVDNSPSLSEKGKEYLKKQYPTLSNDELIKISNNSSYGGRYATIKPLEANEFDSTPPILISDKNGGVVNLKDLDELIKHQDIFRNPTGFNKLSSRNVPQYFIED